MPFSVKLNGNTYTDASFTGNKYADESTGLPAALRDIVLHGQNILTAGSSSSVTIGTGAKSFTLNLNNRPFTPNLPVRVYRQGDANAWMFGTLTSYDATTDVMDVNVTSSSGTGTYTDWIVEIDIGRALDGALQNLASNLNTTSNTNNVAIGTGAKTLIVAAWRPFQIGQFILASSQAAPTTTWMWGQITALNQGANTITLTVTRTLGSGTPASWHITGTGPEGPAATVVSASTTASGIARFATTSERDAWTAGLIASPADARSIAALAAAGGVDVTNTGSTINLTAASKVYQRISTTALGVTVNLAAATTYPNGGPIHVIENTGSNEFPVRDGAGNLLCGVAPGQTVTLSLMDNGTTAGTWLLGGTYMSGCITGPGSARPADMMASGFTLWDLGNGKLFCTGRRQSDGFPVYRWVTITNGAIDWGTMVAVFAGSWDPVWERLGNTNRFLVWRGTGGSTTNGYDFHFMLAEITDFATGAVSVGTRVVTNTGASSGNTFFTPGSGATQSQVDNRATQSTRYKLFMRRTGAIGSSSAHQLFMIDMGTSGTTVTLGATYTTPSNWVNNNANFLDTFDNAMACYWFTNGTFLLFGTSTINSVPEQRYGFAGFYFSGVTIQGGSNYQSPLNTTSTYANFNVAFAPGQPDKISMFGSNTSTGQLDVRTFTVGAGTGTVTQTSSSLNTGASSLSATEIGSVVTGNTTSDQIITLIAGPTFYLFAGVSVATGVGVVTQTFGTSSGFSGGNGTRPNLLGWDQLSGSNPQVICGAIPTTGVSPSGALTRNRMTSFAAGVNNIGFTSETFNIGNGWYTHGVADGAGRALYACFHEDSVELQSFNLSMTAGANTGTRVKIGESDLRRPFYYNGSNNIAPSGTIVRLGASSGARGRALLGWRDQLVSIAPTQGAGSRRPYRQRTGSNWSQNDVPFGIDQRRYLILESSTTYYPLEFAA